MIRAIILLTLTFSTQVLATEFKPYPVAKISVEQWTAYYEKVDKAFADSFQDYPQQKLIVYSNDKERISYVFTKDTHPAHPAWIAHQIVVSDDTVDMLQIGYFAGKEEPFARLFRRYQKLRDKVTAQFNNDSK